MKNIFYFFLYLVYFSTPFESVAIIPGFSVVKLVSILFLIVTLLYYRTIPIPKNEFIIIYFFYTIYAVLSIVWSIDKEITIKYSFGYLIPTFIITSILFYAIQNREQVENIFKAYILGSVIVSISALYEFFYVINQDIYRLVIFGQDANELSFLLAFGIVSAIYLIRFSSIQGVIKIIILAIIFINGFVIMNTGSRTGFVILLVISFISLLMYIKKVQKIIFIFPILIWVSMLLFNYLPEFTVNRLLETSDQIENKDLTGRTYIWTKGISALEQENSYFFGTGFKTFKTLLDNHFNLSRSSHNTYLSTYIDIFN